MTQKDTGAPDGGQVIDCAAVFANAIGESTPREGLRGRPGLIVTTYLGGRRAGLRGERFRCRVAMPSACGASAARVLTQREPGPQLKAGEQKWRVRVSA